MDGKTLEPSGMVKLRIHVEGRLIWVIAAVSEMNGFDLLLGNDALSQLGCFSVQHNDAGVGSFSITPTTSEESPRGEEGYIVNSETLSIPAFSMMHVDVVVPQLGGQNLGHMVEPSPKVMADQGVSIGRILLPSRVTGGTHRFPLTNFSSSTQFIPAGMFVGKILSVDQVLDENREGDPTAVPTEPSLPFASRVNKNLGDEDREKTVALLNRYLRCFAASPHELSRSNVLVRHVIDTGNHLPVHRAPYSSAWRERELINDQTQTMMRGNVIVPSNSAWAAPVVLARKKDGEWRFCVNYHRLNAVTKKDVYPLPTIDDALSRMEGSRYFSILDMQAGYWQVEVDEQDRAKTAFITADGLFEFHVMPFGLTNASATFQRMMDVVLAGLKWNSCLVYLDDIVVFAPTVSQHLERLESVLQRIEWAGLKLKLSKCSFLEQCL
jgi:hypothetical protein